MTIIKMVILVMIVVLLTSTSGKTLLEQLEKIWLDRYPRSVCAQDFARALDCLQNGSGPAGRDLSRLTKYPF